MRLFSLKENTTKQKVNNAKKLKKKRANLGLKILYLKECNIKILKFKEEMIYLLKK